MRDLIEALLILLKYGNPSYPTFCIDEKMIINDIDASTVAADDRERLELLGFESGLDDQSGVDYPVFYSFKFGSA